MLNLKKIVQGLDPKDYALIEENLTINNADNFLTLLKAYREENLKDKEIISKINITSNAFYVLKSRLLDKIQDFLAGDIFSNKEEVIRVLHKISDMCYGSSREVSSAFLQKLEKDLLFYNMHNELLVVYSALKKIHLYSDKYFHYSQLFNKHIAFSLSLEKSEEVLGNFSRTMAQYNFSRSPKAVDTMLFLKKDLANHYSLNKSRQIEIIKNIIDLHLYLFCGVSDASELPPDELILQTQKAINEMPDSFSGKQWITVIDFIAFEYYRKTGQKQNAAVYFEKVDDKFNQLLLYSNLGFTPKFLISKIAYLQETGETAKLLETGEEEFLVDADDTHSAVILGIYNAMQAFYLNDYKDAANQLNDILNSTSFKDFFHINAEVKLTMVFLYLQISEYDLAESILKNVHRKAKSDDMPDYANVSELVKVFNADIRSQGGKVTDRQKDDFTLFLAKNINDTEVLPHLVFELKKRYS